MAAFYACLDLENDTQVWKACHDEGSGGDGKKVARGSEDETVVFSDTDTGKVIKSGRGTQRLNCGVSTGVQVGSEGRTDSFTEQSKCGMSGAARSSLDQPMQGTTVCELFHWIVR